MQQEIITNTLFYYFKQEIRINIQKSLLTPQ